MYLSKKISLQVIGAMLAFGLTLPAFALNTDRDQPLEIEADEASIDDAKGETIYSGNVIVVQGTLRLQANKVVLTYDKKKQVDLIRADGTPARFKQRPDGKKYDVKASANIMEFKIKKDILNLRVNAKITQGKDTFTGENITYEAKRGLIRANGGKSSTGKKGRVKVTVQPSSLRRKSDKKADKTE